MKRRTALKQLAALPFFSLAGVPAVHTSSTFTSAAYDRDDVLFDPAEELAPGVFFMKGNIRFFSSGNYQEVACNNGWVIFDDFVLLIDANFPAIAGSILHEIRKTTDKPIRFVFNTHHHGDHLYGNRFWAQQGATPVAYEGLIGELRRYETGYYQGTPGRWEQTTQKRNDVQDWPLLPPPLTFSQRLVIEDKSQRLELLHLGAGHTRGDGVAWLPGERILFTGDACLNGPYNLLRDADVASWIPTLGRMHQLQPRIIVPGHGPLGNEATPSGQQWYLQQVYDWVFNGKQSNASLDALLLQLPRLREAIGKDAVAKIYLIPAPEKAAGFSLEEHVRKIFESLI